jgi:hypothetical protein
MAVILLFAAMALGGAALLFKNAHELVYNGTPWAADACSLSPLFCSHFEYLAYAAGVVLLLAIGIGIGQALAGDGLIVSKQTPPGQPPACS